MHAPELEFLSISRGHRPGNPVPGPGQLVQPETVKKKKVPPTKLSSSLDLRIVECARVHLSVKYIIRTCKNCLLTKKNKQTTQLISNYSTHTKPAFAIYLHTWTFLQRCAIYHLINNAPADTMQNTLAPLGVLDADGWAVCADCLTRINCGPSGLVNLLNVDKNTKDAE